jgi:tetratricopeptide (TPR) repeat protein
MIWKFAPGGRTTYLMAKCVRIHHAASAGFSSAPHPGLTAIQAVNVGTGILRELASISERTDLHLELEVRIHHALSEAYLLSQDFDRATYHASEMMTLAPVVGLNNLVANAQYQIADARYLEGNLAEAKLLLEEILDSPSTQTRLFRNATIYRALCQYWQGNETAANATLDSLDLELQREYWWLKQMTLRTEINYNDVNLPKNNSLAHALSLFSGAIANVQSENPEHEEQIYDIFKTLSRELHALQPSFGTRWLGTYGRCLEVYASLRSDAPGQIRTASPLPELGEIESMPISARAFGYAVVIEAASKNLVTARQIGLLGPAIDKLVKMLADLNPEVELQVTRKLQLICPFALAMASLWDRAPHHTFELGSNSIINLRQRRIKVYGVSGLRPTHAAKITLSAFGRNDLVLCSRGGAQARDLRRVLHHHYFKRPAWFEPIPPARLIASLLVARDDARSHGTGQSEACQRAAITAYRTYGMRPKMQQTEEIWELEELEEVLTQGIGDPLDINRLAAITIN